MRITRDQIAHGNEMTGEIVLHCLANCGDDMCKAVVEKGYADVVLTVDGVEVDFADFVRHWDSQVEAIITLCARRAVEDKMSDVYSALQDLDSRIHERIAQFRFSWEEAAAKKTKKGGDELSNELA